MHGRIGCCSRNSLSAIMWHGFKLLCDMISNSLFQPVTATHVRRNRWNPYVAWSEESVTARELGLSAIPKYSSYLRPATFDLSDASFRWRMAQQRCSNSILTICCRGESVPIVLLPVLEGLPDLSWETQCKGYFKRLLVWSVWSWRQKGGDDGHWAVAAAAL